MEGLTSTLRTTWTDILQKANCTVLGKIEFRLARIQTNSLFPQQCLLWDENYQASRKVQADLLTEHAHKLNYIVLNNLALIGKGNNPEPTDRESCSNWKRTGIGGMASKGRPRNITWIQMMKMKSTRSLKRMKRMRKMN